MLSSPASQFLKFGTTDVQIVVLSQEKPFTINQISRAIATFSKDKKLFKKIISDVRSRGVDFPLTAETETLLRNEGATDELIEVIRRQSPKPKPAPTSVATPAITPVPTQRQNLLTSFILKAVMNSLTNLILTKQSSNIQKFSN